MSELDLRDVWTNEALSFEQRRDAAVARIGAARWYTTELEPTYQALQHATDLIEFADAWVEFRRWALAHDVMVRLY